MARKDVSMSAAEIAAFLDESRIVQVASIGDDGWPHLVPMWFFVDDGAIVFRSFTKSQKIVNLTRDPRITVLAEAGDTYSTLHGVMIRGRAQLRTDRDFVLRAYGELAARYPMIGDAPVVLDDAALEAAFGRHAEKNTAVVVTAERIASWDHRKLGGAY
jgi:PPOX class probable F420-dependent enzyme